MFDPLKRRSFLKAIPPSLAGGLGGFSAYAAPAGQNDQILIYIFLRGGIDGLNVVTPLGNDYTYYQLMRSTLALPDSGPNKPLALGSEPFGLNPVAAPLHDLYNDGLLAVIQAVGTPDNIASRSHFDAEKYIELGTPGQVNGLTGWLTRHFNVMTQTLDLYPDEMLIPILSFSGTPPTSLLGTTAALTMWSPEDFRIDNAFWRWGNRDDYPDDIMQVDLLASLYEGASDPISQAGGHALIAENIMRNSYNPDYASSGSIAYPTDNNADNNRYFPQRMKDLAQLIKLDPDLSLRIATLDFNGWDTHTGQNDGDYFNISLGLLSQSLAAFIDDLAQSGGDYLDRTTIILQSEFGRRAFQNNDRGTDHGNGNIILAIGKSVNGGQLYGQWPGLYPGDEWVNYPNPKNSLWTPELFEGALATTTDARQILGEFLFKRCQYTSLQTVFPGFSNYAPLGVFKTLDTTPSNTILLTDFEE